MREVRFGVFVMFLVCYGFKVSVIVLGFRCVIKVRGMGRCYLFVLLGKFSEGINVCLLVSILLFGYYVLCKGNLESEII